MPKTKIICTIGPASASPSVLRKMMLAGMDIARLNFSHGTHAGHAAFIDIIRTLNKKYRRHIRILQDLEGFRMRVGDFTDPEGIALVERHHPDVAIYTPAIDRGLDENKYIVPGLGDFGDRLFGTR